MNSLEDFLFPSQERLFKMLHNQFRNRAIGSKGNYLLVAGEVPVLLLAHLDTVHPEPVRTICQSQDGNILMSPQGIGGDDRCGVYSISKVYEDARKKPWLLFTCDEEIGGRGAKAFCAAYQEGNLPEELAGMKLLIEMDRKGSHDAVYYNCDNPALEAYISGKGFQTAFGSFSDISLIAPIMGIAAVNLSSGYYNAHTLHERIHRDELEAVVRKVSEIVVEASGDDFPRYEFISADFGYGWGYDEDWSWWGFDEDFPDDLPRDMLDMYATLRCLYPTEELDAYRAMYGDNVIRELYEAEIGISQESERGGKDFCERESEPYEWNGQKGELHERRSRNSERMKEGGELCRPRVSSALTARPCPLPAA